MHRTHHFARRRHVARPHRFRRAARSGRHRSGGARPRPRTTRASTRAGTSLFYAGFSKTGVGAAETSATFRVPELTCTAVDEGYVITVWAISEDGEFLAGPDLFVYCSDG